MSTGILCCSCVPCTASWVDVSSLKLKAPPGMTDTHLYPTICELIDRGMAAQDDFTISVKRAGTWIDTKAVSFREQINSFAAGLYELGVRHGDRVALHAENSTEWLVADHAILRIGAVTVPIYTTQPPDQVSYILNNAGARVYIVSTQDLYHGVRTDVKAAESVIARIGILGSYGEGMPTLQDVQASGRARLASHPELVEDLTKRISPDDLATLAYTSGTTGEPKGVMLTHSNIASNILSTAKRMPFDPPGRMLSYLPLSHSLERMASFMYLYMGCSIYFVENHLELAEDIKTVRPKHMTSVPRLMEKIHAAVEARGANTTGLGGNLLRWALSIANSYDVTRKSKSVGHHLADRLVFSKLRMRVFGGSLEAITSGGAALAPHTMSFFNAVGIHCGQGYGLTETSPVISLGGRGDLRPGSAGPPLDGIKVRIAEDDEILARGPNIMAGYYGKPEETSEVMGDDGWFHTGDIGHIKDGHIYITDRKKQLFKLSTGKYIAPTPIEIALCESPLIEQAVVIGSERKFCGALIVPDTQAVKNKLGEGAGDEAIHTLVEKIVWNVNKGLPVWEQVKKFHILDAPFTIATGELTPTMKIKRRIVREKYADVINALYE